VPRSAGSRNKASRIADLKAGDMVEISVANTVTAAQVLYPNNHIPDRVLLVAWFHHNEALYRLWPRSAVKPLYRRDKDGEPVAIRRYDTGQQATYEDAERHLSCVLAAIVDRVTQSKDPGIQKLVAASGAIEETKPVKSMERLIRHIITAEGQATDSGWNAVVESLERNGRDASDNTPRGDDAIPWSVTHARVHRPPEGIFRYRGVLGGAELDERWLTSVDLDHFLDLDPKSQLEYVRVCKRREEFQNIQRHAYLTLIWVTVVRSFTSATGNVPGAIVAGDAARRQAARDHDKYLGPVRWETLAPFFQGMSGQQADAFLAALSEQQEQHLMRMLTLRERFALRPTSTMDEKDAASRLSLVNRLHYVDRDLMRIQIGLEDGVPIESISEETRARLAMYDGLSESEFRLMLLDMLAFPVFREAALVYREYEINKQAFTTIVSLVKKRLDREHSVDVVERPEATRVNFHGVLMHDSPGQDTPKSPINLQALSK
jgi:hypothetical protein